MLSAFLKAAPAGNCSLVLQWMRQAVGYLGDCDSQEWWMAVVDKVSECPSFFPIHIPCSPPGLPLLGHGRAASMPASSRVQRGLGLARREQQEPRSRQVGPEGLREEVSLETQSSAPCPPRQEQSGTPRVRGALLAGGGQAGSLPKLDFLKDTKSDPWHFAP